MRNPSEAPAIKASVKIQAASSDMKRTHVDNKTAGAGFKKLMATGMASDKDAVRCKKKDRSRLHVWSGPWKKEKRWKVHWYHVRVVREPVKNLSGEHVHCALQSVTKHACKHMWHVRRRRKQKRPDAYEKEKALVQEGRVKFEAFGDTSRHVIGFGFSTSRRIAWMTTNHNVFVPGLS